MKNDILYKAPLTPRAVIEVEDNVNQETIITVDPQIDSSLSASRNGLVITNYADDAVVKKEAYSIRQVFAVLAGATKQIVFDPSLLANDVFLEPFRVTVSNGAIKMRLTADVAITSGTNELPVFNRYGLTDNPVHKMGCYDVFTGLVIGTEPPLDYIVGSLSTNQSSGGGTTAGDRIFVFEKDKKYLLEFDNTFDPNDTTVSLQFDWFEV